MRLLATYRSLLDNGRLTRLLIGEFVSSIGDWLYLVALLVVVYDQAESPVVLGIVGAARVVPYIVLSVPAGVVADRFDRRLILIATDVARGVLMLLLAGLVATNGPLELIVGGTILAACFSAFFGPAIGSFLPTIVDDESQLGPANSAWATLDNLAFVIGPAVAGILIAAGGIPAAFLLNALSFAVVALVLWRLPSSARDDTVGSRTFEETDDAPSNNDADALGLVRAAIGPLGGLGVINIVASFVFGGLGVITVVLAVDVLAGGDAATGYLNAAIGLGGIVGAAGSAVVVLRRSLVIPLVAGGLALAAGLLLLGFSASLPPALLALVVASAGSLLVEVVSTTVFQRVVPDRIRGRALGVMETIGVTAYAAGAFALPIAVAAIGVQPVLVAGAVAVAASALVGGALVRTTRSAEAAAAARPGAARLLTIPIFAGLPAPRLDAAARQVQLVSVQAGEAVITQGDPADRFYVIDRGSYVVTRRDGTRERELRRMGPGEVFGEIGLLTGSPRTATVTADADGTLLALDRDDFLELVGSGPGLTSRLLDLHRGATVS